MAACAGVKFKSKGGFRRRVDGVVFGLFVLPTPVLALEHLISAVFPVRMLLVIFFSRAEPFVSSKLRPEDTASLLLIVNCLFDPHLDRS